jgi:hypothetical protein
VAELPIGDTLTHIANILQELERDFPELRADVATASGDASGRALRVARQRAERKVLQRRAAYDGGLARAQMMAVAIGGMRNYEAFAGFGLESYERGELAHSIGTRPVFAVDALDKLEEERLFWQTAVDATKAGLPLMTFLRRQGWSDDEIAEYETSPERRAKVAGMEAAELGLSTMRDAAGSEGRGRPEEDAEQGGSPFGN